MAVRRVFIWSCSFCPATAEKAGYGFPDGWGHGFQLTGGPALHYCPACGEAHDLKNGKTIPAEVGPRS